MNLLKQNTDYALRIMANLAARGKTPASTRTLSEEEDVSPQFAAKILQGLSKAGLVKSIMGKDGGFVIAVDPGVVSLNDIISAIQGPITVNKCSPGLCSCARQPGCKIADIMCRIEADIVKRFSEIKLSNI